MRALDVGDEVELLRFDSDVGKHGDTGRSELEALEAVLDGRADAAAVGAASWDVFVRAGEVPPGRLEPFWTSPPYSHCNFTALPSIDAELADAWTAHLRAMDWDDPEHRRILELEGLREWVGPQLDGYRDVFDAVEEQGIAARMVNGPAPATPAAQLRRRRTSAWPAGLMFALDVLPLRRRAPARCSRSRARTRARARAARRGAAGPATSSSRASPTAIGSVYRIRRGERAR